MRLENYIESRYREMLEKNLLNPEFIDLYEGIPHKKLKDILASLHSQCVKLFKLMNERLPTFEDSRHFWAEPSRDLLMVIDIAQGLHRGLKNSEYAFDVDRYYSNIFEGCQRFLKTGGGSPLPPNMSKVELYYKIPIFVMSLTQEISRHDVVMNCDLKLIGEGSYALVYRYKDPYYNKMFALKRAKKNLTQKELERFSREFREMSSLSSPYVVEVYSFNQDRQEYIMEFVDFSLEAYIKQNNSTLTLETRKSISFQILKGFKYLHSKNLKHRDISPQNILIKKYDDIVVVKISDFGLVKIPDSNITSLRTEFKGFFNDPALVTEGFDTYDIQHEIYAITKVLFYVMTGKTNTSLISDKKLADFVRKGLNPDATRRFHDIDQITEAFREFCGS